MGQCIMCGKESELNSAGICAECEKQIDEDHKLREKIDGMMAPKKSKKEILQYFVLSIVGIVLLFAWWPLIIPYVSIVSITFLIVNFKKTKRISKPFIFLLISSVVFICLAVIAYKIEPKTVSSEDIKGAAEISLCQHYNNLELVPQIDNASVIFEGNSLYAVTGQMKSIEGGFIYNVTALVEVSPDQTETRVDQINLTRSN